MSSPPSLRCASRHGRVSAGGGLPPPQAAGWGSETGHQTLEKWKQQTQGTLVWSCYDYIVVFYWLTWSMCSHRQKRWEPSWPPCLHSAPPNCPKCPKEPCLQRGSTPASIAGLMKCWESCSSWVQGLKWWTSPGRQQVCVCTHTHCNFLISYCFKCAVG